MPLPEVPDERIRVEAVLIELKLRPVLDYDIVRDAIRAAVADERERYDAILEEVSELLEEVQRDEETVAAGLWQGPRIGRTLGRVAAIRARTP